jgi:hypothetical protein
MPDRSILNRAIAGGITGVGLDTFDLAALCRGDLSDGGAFTGEGRDGTAAAHCGYRWSGGLVRQGCRRVGYAARTRCPDTRRTRDRPHTASRLRRRDHRPLPRRLVPRAMAEPRRLVQLDLPRPRRAARLPDATPITTSAAAQICGAANTPARDTRTSTRRCQASSAGHACRPEDAGPRRHCATPLAADADRWCTGAAANGQT